MESDRESGENKIRVHTNLKFVKKVFGTKNEQALTYLLLL